MGLGGGNLRWEHLECIYRIRERAYNMEARTAWERFRFVKSGFVAH